MAPARDTEIERARAIVARLRRNGGPLATEAADCISALMRLIPDTPTSDIHHLHRRLILLFQRRINKPSRGPKEMRAWRKIAPRVTDEDVAALERFYRAPKARTADETWSRKTAVLHLLSQYHEQVDLAHSWADKHPAPKPRADTCPEPPDWQRRAPGNLGSRSWSQVAAQYRDIAALLQDPATDLSDGVQ